MLEDMDPVAQLTGDEFSKGGVQIDVEANWKGRDSYIFAAPVNIGR